MAIFLTSGADSFAGTAADQTLFTRSIGPTTGDSVRGEGGTDTLSLVDGGTFDLRRMTVFTGFEKIAMDAQASILFVSDGQSLQITLGAGGNQVTGGTGNETIIAGAAADTMTGGAGNDRFQGSAASFSGDRVTDFAVGDSIVVTDVNLSGLNGAAASSTLATGGAGLTLAGISAASGTWSAVRNGAATTLTLLAPTDSGDDGEGGGGGSPSPIITGGGDQVTYGSGNDQIAAMEGDDTIDAGPGDDLLWGQQANDVLQGDAGRDFIWGGVGDDIVRGAVPGWLARVRRIAQERNTAGQFSFKTQATLWQENGMKRALILGVVGIGLMGGLSACADNYGGGYGDAGYRSDAYYGSDGRLYRSNTYWGDRDNMTPRTQLQRDRAAARDPNCRATFLHQDRPGGSDYDPRLGAPSC